MRAQIFFVPVPFFFRCPPPTERLCRACGRANRSPSGPVAAHRSPSACVARIDRTAWPGSLSASPRGCAGGGLTPAHPRREEGRRATDSAAPSPHPTAPTPHVSPPLSPPPRLLRPPAEHPLWHCSSRLASFRAGCPRWPALPPAPAAARACRSRTTTAAFPDGEDTLLCVGGDAGMRAVEVGP